MTLRVLKTRTYLSRLSEKTEQSEEAHKEEDSLQQPVVARYIPSNTPQEYIG